MGDLPPEVGLRNSSVQGWTVGGQGGQEVRLRPGSILSDGRPSQGIRPAAGREETWFIVVFSSWSGHSGGWTSGRGGGLWVLGPCVMHVSREAVCACVHVRVCVSASLHAEIIMTSVSESSKFIDI